ncbi:phage tail assembly protein T [Anatilimnocola floriformis]|uniref:phage tail assembly protein T n=1 Tax=Anatilimnocola floriformis TaxID=2948575 RepID=UPI0020C53044|nr:hypothetical protein [Anatilimnocola floriformis]
MTVEELLDRISSAELSEWMADYQFEPFGNDWLQTASICTLVGNIVGKKNGGTFKPQDFLPVKPPPKPRPKRQTAEQMLAIFRTLASN